MHREHGCNPTRRRRRALSIVCVKFAAVTALILSGVPLGVAETTCHAIYNPQFPGLQQCTARVHLNNVQAHPPEP